MREDPIFYLMIGLILILLAAEMSEYACNNHIDIKHPKLQSWLFWIGMCMFFGSIFHMTTISLR